MNTVAASFTGTAYLSKPDPVLSISGAKYVACFFSPTGSGGQLLGKSSAWALTYSGSAVSFTVVGTDNITYTATDSSHAINNGSWYFAEGYQDASGNISVAVTEVGGPVVDVFYTPVTMGVTTSKTAGTFAVGLLCQANIHTALVADEIPNDEERDFLYAQGNGRRYWELDSTLKSKMAAFWQLSATSGTRTDKVGTSSLTETSGTVATVTRTTHPLNGTLLAAAELIASSYTFQDWTGTGTASAALARIFVESNDTDINTRPNALVMSNDSSVNMNRGRFASGSVMFQIEADPLDGDDSVDSRTEFENRVTKIVGEMMENSSNGGYLFVRQIEKTMPITLSSRKESEVYYGIAYRLDWGVE